MGAIVVSNLGKAYKQYPTRWSRLREWFRPGKREYHSVKWVLKDINFTIQPGEAVGVIGINGAGKSTLLKMITGTTQPTTGSVQINGRVAALLELGMGFHPDFTGRQNAYMAGQLLGYNADEISELMPEIEAFAQIGAYIDQPVRVYSSGMQVRLAFAVATAIRPDVLIVDEALSVGDAAFQRKCFQRIEGFRDAGTTLLFVSHDTGTVKKICDKALYIRDGSVVDFADSKKVCDLFEKDLFGLKETAQKSNGSAKHMEMRSESRFDPSLWQNTQEISLGGDFAEIKEFLLMAKSGESINLIEEGEPFKLSLSVFFKKNCEGVHYGIRIRTVEGIDLYGTNTDCDGTGQDVESNSLKRIEFRFNNALMPGVYYATCGVSHKENEGREFLHRRVDCLMFRVVEKSRTRHRTGLVNLFAEHDFANLSE